MSHSNRMGEFFEGVFGPDGPSGERQQPEIDDSFVYHISFPDSPETVRQSVRVVGGRLVVRVEFEFEDVDLLETLDDL